MDWGGANSRFLGLVSVWAARSFDQTALRPSGIKRIRQIDVKYITHITSFGVTALLNSNGELTCDNTEKANILNSTFTSVFTRENTKYIPTMDNVFNGAPLQDLSISQQMVENKLSKLKNK